MIAIPRSVYIAIAIVLAVFGIYRWGFHKGWTERDVEMQAEIAIKNEESRVLEQKLVSQVNENEKKLHEANNVIDEKQSALTAAIRAGRVRLPAPSCVQAAPSAAPAAPNPENGTQSDEQTLLLIAAIAADGDKAINQLNACIDSYQQVREQLNGK
jgi:hypothetical protein